MKQKLHAAINFPQRTLAWSPILIGALSLFIAIAVFVVILVNRSPNFLRPMSIALRTDFSVTAGLYLALLYLAFRLKGWLGQSLSLVLTLALFAFPLAGAWAVGHTQPTLFNGIVPLFDASDYYTDALRLLAGQDFSVFSARRPLFAGLLAVVLWLANYNLMTALGILTFLTGLACFISAKEIQRTHGAEVAVLTLAILFLYYRYHSGLTMSENLGLPLGALGFALLWRGTADRNKLLVWSGLLVITLALNARAGTFFMLPLLLLWFGWFFRSSNQKYSWSFFVYGSTAVILGFVINLVMFRLLATPTGVPFANFSYTLYGLAAGGESWIYVFNTHPELYQLQEPYQSREVYRMAFELIRDQPHLIVQGAFHSWSMLFSNSWYGAYSYVAEENWTLGMIAQWGLFLLCVLGIVRGIRNREDPLNALVCIAAAGVFISVPFLPPTDAYRMRPYAVSIVVFGLLPAMGLLFAIEKVKLPFLGKESLGTSYLPAVSILSVLFILSSTLGAAVLKTTGTLPAFADAACEPGLDLVAVRFDPSTHFNVIRQKAPGLDWMPNFHIGRFRSNSHSMADSSMIAWTDEVEPEESLFYSLDFQSMQKVLILTSTERLPAAGSLWQVCGEWESDPHLSNLYRIFYVRAEPLASAD